MTEERRQEARAWAKIIYNVVVGGFYVLIQHIEKVQGKIPPEFREEVFINGTKLGFVIILILSSILYGIWFTKKDRLGLATQTANCPQPSNQNKKMDTIEEEFFLRHPYGIYPGYPGDSLD